LVFKVLFRQPGIKVAFQTLSCQQWLQGKRLKSSSGNGLGVCANLNSVLNSSKAEVVRV
jgi:predicted transcriptional regulator